MVYYLCEKSEEMRVENYGAWSTGWQEKEKGKREEEREIFQIQSAQNSGFGEVAEIGLVGRLQ